MVTCQKHMGKDEASKPLVVIKQNAPNPSDILKTSLVKAERCRVVEKKLLAPH